MKRGNTVFITISTEFDLRDADVVEVIFSQGGKIVLDKMDETVLVGEKKVQVVLSKHESSLFDPGRYVATEVRAHYDEGVTLVSNIMYRPFDGIVKKEKAMNAKFGDVSVIVSRREAERIWDKFENVDEKDATQDEAIDTKVDKIEGKGLSSNDYTDDEKDKLEGIEAGAEVNVQPDWNEDDTDDDDYIKNKPEDLTTDEIDEIIDSLE